MEAGLMAENIAIAAGSLNIGTCIIGSLGALMNNELGNKWKGLLEIDSEYKFLIAVSLGYVKIAPPVKEREPFEDHFKIFKVLNL